MSETLWCRKDNWVGTQIEDSFVMLNFEGGEYVSLNSSASDVWHALETPQSVRALVAALTARYDIAPEQCAQSVDRLLTELQAKGLICTSV